MNIIYKYKVNLRPCANISDSVLIPENSEILHINNQNGEFYVWAQVDTDEPLVEYYFEIFGTGHEMVVDMGVDRKYLNTFMMHDGSLVFHAYIRNN